MQNYWLPFVINYRQAGHTLLELLVVVALVGMVFMLGIPAYKHLFSTHSNEAYVSQLVNDLNYARSTAVAQHTVVTVCRSASGQWCDGQWQQGWLIFIDPSARGQRTPAESILRVHGALPSSSRLEWVGFRSNDYVQFDSRGSSHGQAGSFTFYLRVPSQEATQIIISQTGRIRVTNSRVK